jgi:hypothetical protein
VLAQHAQDPRFKPQHHIYTQNKNYMEMDSRGIGNELNLGKKNVEEIKDDLGLQA